MKKIFLLSLGCPRNLTDSEVLQELLEKKGFTVVDSAEGSDVAIVNTCGFIDDAKQQSIDSILELAELKKEGKVGKIVVCGCLSQRYSDTFVKEISEIDGIFGTAELAKIPDSLELLFKGDKIRQVSDKPGFLYDHSFRRKLFTPSHYVYLKIQEGCSNRCSYCIIPDLKGPANSRTIDSVLIEAESLIKEHNVKELVLIGQDTTSFGIDRSGKAELAELLRALSPMMAEGWIRLLYTHPNHFSDELIDVIKNYPNICRYVDIPIQHINDRILKKMNRRITKNEITGIIKKLREQVEGVTLRTSIIVGFPGETRDEFRELMEFLKDIKFERLGAFRYSREEGTPAHGFSDQVEESVKEKRFEEVMMLQQEVSKGNNLKHLGRTYKTLIDEKVESDKDLFIGRTEMDAPEVDGVIFVKGENLKIGEFRNVKITGTMEYDLMGEAQ